MRRLADITHVVLRVGVGLLFLQHGLQKVFGIPGGTPVPLASLFGVAGVMELAGGVLLVVGFLTRPVAAVLTVQMCAAYVIGHLPQGVWPILNDGEEALLYALTFAFLAGHGAGALSVDARRARD
jgi:putative oxidoreductase